MQGRRVKLPVVGRRVLFSLLLAATPLPAGAQSQADKTGTGMVAAGQDYTQGITVNQILLGVAVAALVGAGLAIAASDASPVGTTTTATTTSPVTTTR